MKKDFMFTSESVTEGHPDKLCDQISDAIVDHFLQQDPYARVIAECAVSTSILFIAARFCSTAVVDFPHVARQVINLIGYDQPEFNGKTCSIVTSLKEQPEDCYAFFNEKELSDDEIERIPVKNQVTVFGFACRQTASLMPLPIWLAHKLARKLTAVRLQKSLPYIAPDGKTQVGVEYRDRIPHRIHSITVIASQRNQSDADMQKLSADIRSAVIDPVFTDEAVRPDEKTMIFVNPDGPFVTAVHQSIQGLPAGRTPSIRMENMRARAEQP